MKRVAIAFAGVAVFDRRAELKLAGDYRRQFPNAASNEWKA